MKNSALSRRLRLSDALWKTIEPIILKFKRNNETSTKLSNRMFVEAILYQARTGNPWRDMPEEFGSWGAAYKRFRHWERKGIWKRIWKHLQSLDAKPARNLFIDSTVVRAHQHSTGAPKNSGGKAKRFERKLKHGSTVPLFGVFMTLSKSMAVSQLLNWQSRGLRQK